MGHNKRCQCGPDPYFEQIGFLLSKYKFYELCMCLLLLAGVPKLVGMCPFCGASVSEKANYSLNQMSVTKDWIDFRVWSVETRLYRPTNSANLKENFHLDSGLFIELLFKKNFFFQFSLPGFQS